ncbi:hypothetical protein F5879DRAFT_994530 [Lentinula edodes]|nr:hypothetical protein F5879DRAFT_994530 [Lentinula edodes]
MGIATHHIASLDNIEAICPENYGSVLTTWEMFLTGISTNYVCECAVKVPTTPNKLAPDAELVLIMFTHIHPDYCHHLCGIKSGLVMWKEIQKFCVSSTLHSQILAWHHFTHFHHDIDCPIGVYLDSIDKAVDMPKFWLDVYAVNCDIFTYRFVLRGL